MSPESRLPRSLAIAYIAWAGTAFLLLGFLALLVILVLPRLAWRRRVTRWAARAALRLSAIRVTVLGAEHLPEGRCVVVANHASYLDGVVLFATLPPNFGFVIKREMDGVPLASMLLRRIGSHFVDRSGATQGKRDARALLREARAGGSMAIFPEGTFQREPGLARFRQGAFVIAANGALPIVPVALRGTRQALPPGTALLRPGRVEVDIAPALPPPRAGDPQSIGAALRASREAILARITEPDLAPGG